MKIKLLQILAMQDACHPVGKVLEWPCDLAAQRMIDAGICVEDPATVAARKKAEAEAKAAADKAAAEDKKKAAAAAKVQEAEVTATDKQKMVAEASEKPEQK